jgi:hypothetical protein
LQTVKGEVAKAPPATEIQDLVRKIWADVRVKDPQWAKQCEEGQAQVYWSWDNCPAHTLAMAEWDKKDSWRKKEGIPGVVVWPPKYSPDLHQVIEHAHGNTVRRFREWLIAHCHDAPLPQVLDYIPIIRKCFHDSNTVEGIRKNVERLTMVYEKVIESGGGYIAREWR